MPTVLRHEGFRFFFYSNEGNPREPVHVHVMRAGAEAKLRPEVSVADTIGFDARTLRQVMEIAAAHRERIERAWDEHLG